MSRLALVAFLVLAAAISYRAFGSAETGTGTLTLAQPAPNEGEKAPSFTARSFNEGTFELDGDSIYVLTFWSTLNESSDKALPEFAGLAEEFGDSGVSFAAVYVNSAPRNAADAPYAVIQDPSGRLTSMYNVKRVPRLFLIRDGTVALVQNGYYEGNEEQLEEELKRTLEEKNASPA